MLVCLFSFVKTERRKIESICFESATFQWFTKKVPPRRFEHHWLWDERELKATSALRKNIKKICHGVIRTSLLLLSPDRGADVKAGGAGRAFPLSGWRFCRVAHAAESRPEGTGPDVSHHHSPWCWADHTEGRCALWTGSHCGESPGEDSYVGGSF